tara:strand:+ start:381 stop:1199 length:819 start_codon:yes stop_codon:yes gene_type:complete
MSSIYRKGRDGYFYYQTYIYNPETGKKNKRIFHALGTQDENIAIKKKIKYDEKYEKKENSKVNHYWYKENKIFKAFLIISGLLGLLHFTIESKIFFTSDLIKNNLEHKKNLTEYDKNDNIGKVMNDTDSDIVGTINKDSSDMAKNENKNIIQNVERLRSIVPKIKIPEFEIMRIEEISGGFNQIKIFAVIKSQNNAKALNRLSEKLVEQYSQFQNVLICYYKDTSIGRSIALGNTKNFLHEDQNDSWLAMVTFNPIEGWYLDHNPGEYFKRN